MSDLEPAWAAWQHLMHHAAVLVLRVAADGHVVEANGFARKRLGRPTNGGHIREIFCNVDSMLSMSEFFQRPMPVLLSVNTASGMPESYLFHSMPVDSTTLFIGEFDHAETERLRRQLSDANGALLTTTRELQKQNAELQRSNKAKSELLGMAAHDLRNPMHAIGGYAELLLDRHARAGDSESVQLLGAVQELVTQMAGLLDATLSAAAIEAGEMRLALAHTDIGELVSSGVSFARLLGKRKQISVSFRCEPGLPALWLDPTKMRQVIDNLIGNAVKYSSPGSSVRVSVTSGKDEIQLCVQDQGAGISSENQKLLFKPFCTAGTVPTGNESSAGLGLAIVKRIVAAHHGKICVDSQPGQGTSFVVVLPLPPRATSSSRLDCSPRPDV